MEESHGGLGMEVKISSKYWLQERVVRCTLKKSSESKRARASEIANEAR
jgi:hypothetical protein